MTVVGYKLVNKSGDVVQEWGGIWGQTPGIPNPLFLPDGTSICGGVVPLDAPLSGGYRLVTWEMDGPPPKTVYTRRSPEVTISRFGAGSIRSGFVAKST